MHLSIRRRGSFCLDEKLKEAEKQGINKLIIDLRYNNGGGLDTLLNIASLFLDKGTPIIKIESKKGTDIKESFGNNDKKYEIVDKITSEFKKKYPNRVIDINGARVSFDNGWGLVRASSNLPELVLIFEGKTKDDMMNIRNIFKNELSKYKEISPNWENDVI